MSDLMTFPNTVEEFMEKYKIVDTYCVYTNGVEMVPIFRMQQWFDHARQLRNNKCMPTVDAVPVVHAHWESAEFDDELKTCSNCHIDKDNNGTTWYYIRPEWRYCPLCGAIMDEVSE